MLPPFSLSLKDRSTGNLKIRIKINEGLDATLSWRGLNSQIQQSTNAIRRQYSCPSSEDIRVVVNTYFSGAWLINMISYTQYIEEAQCKKKFLEIQKRAVFSWPHNHFLHGRYVTLNNLWKLQTSVHVLVMLQLFISQPKNVQTAKISQLREVFAFKAEVRIICKRAGGRVRAETEREGGTQRDYPTQWFAQWDGLLLPRVFRWPSFRFELQK